MDRCLTAAAIRTLGGQTMTRITTRTGSRLGIGILTALMLAAMLAIPAMAHDTKVDYGIQAITITSA